MSERKGQCACGAVQYRISDDPITTRVCWCRDCQRLSANGTVNALFKTASIEVSGALTEHASFADSGNQMQKRFCPVCGTHLFANSSARPHITAVRIGTLDDPSSVKPSVNIWVQSAPTWACIDPTIERVEKQPAAPQTNPGIALA